VGKSRFKRAHRTHAFDQRPGDVYPQSGAEEAGPAGAPGDDEASDEASRLFTELCERVPDAATRASLIGVSVTLDEAWRRRERLPILRAHRKSVERALRAAPRD
jgi:hypothetical protein